MTLLKSLMKPNIYLQFTGAYDSIVMCELATRMENQFNESNCCRHFALHIKQWIHFMFGNCNNQNDCRSFQATRCTYGFRAIPCKWTHVCLVYNRISTKQLNVKLKVNCIHMFSTFETNAKSNQKLDEWAGVKRWVLCTMEVEAALSGWYWRKCVKGKSNGADMTRAYTFIHLHSIHTKLCNKNLWYRQLFAWFFIVKMSFIYSYQEHTATIESRKNNDNNHKSVRIKETKVAAVVATAKSFRSIYAPIPMLLARLTHWL